MAEGKIGLHSLKTWCTTGANKWRIGLIAFMFVYALFLVFGYQDVHDLVFMSPQWDELPHLNGGLVLFQGHFSSYFQFGGYYPPLFDLVTAGFFGVGGVSVFSARMVAVVFSLLTIYIIFEFVNRLYDVKTGFLASIILAIMPGYYYLSRIALIETMLAFFFTISVLSFWLWLREHQKRFLIISGLTVGLGFLAKYQIILVIPILLTSFVLFNRGFLKRKLPSFALMFLVATLIVIPWAIISYRVFNDYFASQWLYTLDSGNTMRDIYKTGFDRFPEIFMMFPSWLKQSTFYLFEITMPYPDVHPVSALMFMISFAGLGWLALRHKSQDTYLLIWFTIVYIFFSVIPNKEWRYLIPIFPVLAVAAANIIIYLLSKTERLWKHPDQRYGKKIALKITASALIIVVFIGGVFSIQDAYYLTSRDQVQIPIETTSNYIVKQIGVNQSIVIVCPQDLFTQDDFYFYLLQNGKNNTIIQYPEQPVDSFAPDFNISAFVSICRDNQVRYVLLSEHRATIPYFNSTLDFHEVARQIYDSGKINNITQEMVFGTVPNRIIILTFNE